MNVLLTNIYLDTHSGTEVYTRDLAVALHGRGIHVEVYSPHHGIVAEEIRNAGIHVADAPHQLLLCPDIIHGHQYEPTIQALACFPGTPALYFVHGRYSHLDTPVKHSRVMKYLASDHNTLDRLIIDEGIPTDQTAVLLNWVDTQKFLFKEHHNDIPKKALVFSNYVSDKNYLPVIRRACRAMNMSLDCIGRSVGREIKHPERELGNYDIIFAKAKAAIEAMATGACVIPCDTRGLGEIVTTQNYRYYRDHNFGMKILSRPITPEGLIGEIKKYDRTEATKVAALIREEANLPGYVDKLLGHYNEIITKYHDRSRNVTTASGDIQYFESPLSIVLNRVDETEKNVNKVLSYKLKIQEQHIQYLEAQLAHYKKSLFNRGLSWLRRKTGKG